MSKPDELAPIAKLWAQGVPTSQMAIRLGMPKGTVCRLARNARMAGDPRFPVRGFYEARWMAARQTLKPRPAPRAPPPARVRTSPVPIWELEPHECRYPVGQSEEHEHLFCAAPKHNGSPYCRKHETLCMGPGRETRRLADKSSALA